MKLAQLLLSALPKTIQCSNYKQEQYRKGVNKAIAIDEYNFIQLQHPAYYKFLSIDIDNKAEFTTFSDIIKVCQVNHIPIPTIIVETNKGWHIHWALKQPVWKNNKYLTHWRSVILSELNNIFGGDKHFASFIVRNPLKHNHFYVYSEYDYKDFDVIASFDDIKKLKFADKKHTKYRGKKFYDFTKVKVGERNTNLFNYLRQFGYVNFENCSVDKLTKEGLRVNNLMQEPLPENEVISTAKSVWKHVIETYDPNRYDEEQIKKNRELAKKRKEKKIEEITENVRTLAINGAIKFYDFFKKNISFRKLSKMIGIDRRTIAKHFVVVVKKLLIKIKRFFKNEYVVFSIPVIYADKNVVGVLIIDDPPT